jgi:predicted HAD superfamily Cof-like phosphohydrolase
MSNFDTVGLLYRHFGYITEDQEDYIPHHVENAVADFRVKFLHEEVMELQQAYIYEDLPGIADALVDIVVVALGTAHLHGFPWEELFEEVQTSNMQKQRARSAQETIVSRLMRGSATDLIKPAHWKPPNIHEILAAHGWKKEDED